MNRRWIYSWLVVCILSFSSVFATSHITSEIENLRHSSAQNNSSIPFMVHRSPQGLVTMISGVFSENVHGNFQVAGLNFLETHKQLFGISNVQAEFQQKALRRDIFGLHHLTLQQVYQGIPVLNRLVKVHSNATGQLSGVTSTYFPGINISTSPALAPEDAVTAIAVDGQKIVGHKTPKLVIYIDGQTPKLAYSIDAAISPREAYQFIIDAQNGQILQQYALVQTGESVYGYGVDVLGDVTDSLHVYQGTDFYRNNIQDVIDIWNNQYGYANYTPTAGNYNLVDFSDTTEGAIYTLTSYDTTYYHVNFVQSVVDSFNSDSAQFSHQSGVSAHVYHRDVLDYYYSHFGRRSWDDNGERVVGIVDFGHNYFNAFYNGYTSTMNYGGAVDAGTVVFRPFSGCLDIVAHEFTHGITGNTSHLIYQNQPGALNEHFSDAFGYFIEAAYQNGGDWYIGEDLTDYPTYLGIRDMSNPPNENQPDRVGGPYYVAPTDNPTSSNDYGGVHTNSGIPNKVLYLLVHGGLHYGINVTPFAPNEADARQIASQLWYTWGTEYLSPRDNFSSAYRKMLMTCNDLFPGNTDYYRSIQDAWSSVGVYRDMYVNLSVNPGYLPPASGVVHIQTVLKNIPDAYDSFEVTVESDSTHIDTLALYNDGQHNDGAAQDTIWAVDYPTDSLEATYQVNFLATDSISGYPDVYADLGRFTTIGPMKFHEITFTTDTLPQPGDNYYIQFSLENLGSSSTATNVSARLTSLDSNITVANSSNPSFGDIPAGGFGTSSSGVFLIQIGDNSPVDTDLPVLVTIASNNYAFWTDTMFVHVSRIVGVDSELKGIPSDYALHENYPNPFNPTTTIQFDLPKKANVRLIVFDMLGRQIKTLVSDEVDAGYHKITWDGTNNQGYQVGTGVYIYRLETRDFHDSGKMVLLK